MAVTLNRQDLLADIKDADLTRIGEHLVNDGDPAPIERAIAWASAEVGKYIAGYVVPEEEEAGYVRGLAIWRLFFRLPDEIPDTRQKECDRIYRELRETRDGKFQGRKLATAPSAEGTSGRGRWGSRARIQTASEAREAS